MCPLNPVVRVLRSILPRSPSGSRCAKKDQGATGGNPYTAPWRQGTETGSTSIVLLTIWTVKPQRQLG